MQHCPHSLLARQSSLKNKILSRVVSCLAVFADFLKWSPLMEKARISAFLLSSSQWYLTGSEMTLAKQTSSLWQEGKCF